MNFPDVLLLCREFYAISLKTVSDMRRFHMLRWVMIFLIMALIAGALGFTGIAGAAVGIAKIIFFIFMLLVFVSLLFMLAGRRR